MRISDWSSDVCSSDLLVDDHAGRADLRTDPWRLHLRQLFVAVDLLHQHTGRPVLRIRLLAGPQDARNTDAQVAGRRHRTGPADRLGWRAARSDARRVGDGWVSTGRSRWLTYH